MKIYFTGSVCGGRDDQEVYYQIIQYLKKYGEVLTEHLGDPKLSNLGESIPLEDVYKRDMDFLKKSDVLVGEVSTPSLGVGYEIAKAEQWGKRILCLCKKFEDGKRLSRIIKGNKNLITQEYTNLEEAFKQIENFFKENPK